MTVTVSTQDAQGNRTLTFTKTAPSAKILDVGDKAVRWLFTQGYGNHGTPANPRKYSDLSNAEKLTILDQYITQGLQSLVEAVNRRDYTEAYVPPDVVLGVK
jgi:hypothetical protein